MFDIQLNLYKVYDTFEGKYWVPPKGKDTWDKPHFAKNAVNANPPEFMWTVDRHGRKTRHQSMKFSEQDRLIIEHGIYTLVTANEIS
jgi:hypothetical protein